MSNGSKTEETPGGPHPPAGELKWPEKPPPCWPPDLPWPPGSGTGAMGFSSGFYYALFAGCVAALMAMGVPQGEAIATCLKKFIPSGALVGGPTMPPLPRPPNWPPDWPWPPPWPPTWPPPTGPIGPSAAGDGVELSKEQARGRIRDEIEAERQKQKEYLDLSNSCYQDAASQPDPGAKSQLLHTGKQAKDRADEIEHRIEGKKTALGLI